MSDDPNDKELPEEEDISEGQDTQSSTEAKEIELEPVGTDEGPGNEGAESNSGSSALLGKGKLSEKDDKTFGMLAHLLGAFTSFVGPLVIWMIKKEESPFIDDQGKEALNFQITIAIALVVSMILSAVPFLSCVAMLLSPAIGIAGLVFAILACLKANEGTAYRYPYCLRLIK